MLEAITSRLEAIASRLEAIANRLEASRLGNAAGMQPSQLLVACKAFWLLPTSDKDLSKSHDISMQRGQFNMPVKLNLSNLS